MVLSTLVGEECQASCWLFATDCFLFAVAILWLWLNCIYPSPTLTLIFCLSIFKSLLPLSFSLNCIFLFLTYSPINCLKSCFNIAPLLQMAFVHSVIDFIKWLWSITLYVPCVLARPDLCMCMCVCACAVLVFVCLCVCMCVFMILRRSAGEQSVCNNGRLTFKAVYLVPPN